MSCEFVEFDEDLCGDKFVDDVSLRCYYGVVSSDGSEFV